MRRGVVTNNLVVVVSMCGCEITTSGGAEG